MIFAMTPRRVQPLPVCLALGVLSLVTTGLSNAACQGPPAPVSADPHAIQGTQPLAWKRISAICSPCNDALSFNTSPQTGFST